MHPDRLPLLIVLASGRGERFIASGGTEHKLCARLAGRPVLAHTLAAADASGLRWHLEQAAHPGMGDAIAAAVRAHPGAPGWMILPADLPLVRAATLRRIAEAAVEGIAVPMHQGRRGHPVRFPAARGPELMGLRGDQGAQTLLRAHGFTAVEVDDIGCVTDIDTLDDLRRAEALWTQERLATVR